MGEEQFNVGDKVRLKSGGPIMTVTNPYGGLYVTCDWFEGGHNTKSFPPDALERVDEQADEAS